jgi:hypothetical protein
MGHFEPNRTCSCGAEVEGSSAFERAIFCKVRVAEGDSQARI